MRGCPSPSPREAHETDRGLDGRRGGCDARRDSCCDDGGTAGPALREPGLDHPDGSLGTDCHRPDCNRPDCHRPAGHGPEGTAGDGHASRSAAGDDARADAGDPHADRVDPVGVGRDFSDEGSVGWPWFATEPAGGPGNRRLVGTERAIAGVELFGSDRLVVFAVCGFVDRQARRWPSGRPALRAIDAAGPLQAGRPNAISPPCCPTAVCTGSSRT